MRPRHYAVGFVGFVLALGLMISCGGATATPTLPPVPPTPSVTPCVPGSTGEPSATFDLAPFKQQASSGVPCSDIRNRLFLIDGQFVFWDRAGNCADAAYYEMLYGSAPDQILCQHHDSIAGPVNECQDEQYRDLFDTITANLDKPDLGLGTGHTVQTVCF